MSVLIIGAGLVGSSVGMALTAAGIDVRLEDLASSHAVVAAGLGAGDVNRPAPDEVDLVVVATPPQTVAPVALEALRRFPDAVVTDVGSVKAPILAQIAAGSDDAARFVGSHPMAGSQFTGPLTANARLFEGRTWVITPSASNPDEAVARVVWLAETCGAVVVEMPAAQHDEAVAQVSHVPHLMSILTASHLREVPPEHLQLAGQGIRDVTRIAGSDPSMWRQIIAANAAAVREELTEVADDLRHLLEILEEPGQLEEFLQVGRDGAHSLLVKHGNQPQEVVRVVVEVPDQPRALERLFSDIGELGFNVEDFDLRHDAVRQVGYLSIAVLSDQATRLREKLVSENWNAWEEE